MAAGDVDSGDLERCGLLSQPAASRTLEWKEAVLLDLNLLQGYCFLVLQCILPVASCLITFRLVRKTPPPTPHPLTPLPMAQGSIKHKTPAKCLWPLTVKKKNTDENEEIDILYFYLL